MPDRRRSDSPPYAVRVALDPQRGAVVVDEHLAFGPKVTSAARAAAAIRAPAARTGSAIPVLTSAGASPRPVRSSRNSAGAHPRRGAHQHAVTGAVGDRRDVDSLAPVFSAVPPARHAHHRALRGLQCRARHARHARHARQASTDREQQRDLMLPRLARPALHPTIRRLGDQSEDASVTNTTKGACTVHENRPPDEGRHQ